MFDLLDAPKDLAELVHRAPAIAHVAVSRIITAYYWPGTDVRPQPGGLIVSDIELTVTRPIKGNLISGIKLVVFSFQGTLDGTTQTNANSPDLRPGENYILFLQPESRFLNQLPDHGLPRFQIFYDWIGRFRIESGIVEPANPGKSAIHKQFKGIPVTEFVSAIEAASR